MPAVPKTSAERIVRAARRLVAKRGAQQLSMHALAKAVGVKPPSLYKHFPNRSAILRAVLADVVVEWAGRQEETATSGAPEEDLVAVAHALRDFAHRWPGLYALLFNPLSPDVAPSPAQSRTLVAPLLKSLARWSGDTVHALEGARLLVAFTHGFVSMELAGAFRLGGDVDVAFDFGLARVLGALAPPRRPRRR